LARKQRTIAIGQEKEEIRRIIEETGMKYATIPNGLFDDIYTKNNIKGLVQEEIGGKKQWIEGDTKFTELELIVFIFLQFMMMNKFTLTYTQFAEYIGCSSKQLKVVLKRLQHFKGVTNARYSTHTDGIVIDEEKEVPLITEKLHTAYNPKTKKNQKTLHWYTNYIPNHKETKNKSGESIKPINFFLVTLDDFELLINEKLTRNEFVTYLFLLKAYKPSVDVNHQMYWKLSTISEHLNYKLVTTVHNHIEKLLSLNIDSVPLLEEIRPKNYDMQISKGEEPSSRYIPIFNPKKLVEMDSAKEEMNSSKVEMSFSEQEMSSENMETDNPKVEMSFEKEEIGLSEQEMSYYEKEMTVEELEALFE